MLTMISGILFLQSFLIHIDLKEQQQQQKNKKQKRTGSIVLLNNGDTSKICTKNLLLYKKSFSWATICLFYFSFLRCWLEVKDSC